MKKIFLLIIFLFTFFLTIDYSFANCKYDWNWDLSNALTDCKPKKVAWNQNDYKIEWWLKTQILDWVKNIWILLWFLAVFAIVYWSLMMTLSTWDDEKIKKAKDIVKWWIVWFVALISAPAIIAIVIKLMYTLSV